jgi:uncharacterized membrane protein YeaQ/YmgE (transglycosylase-associated protein family)
MKYIKMAIVGLIVGLIAQALYPGDQQTAWYIKIAVGIAGSLLVGTLGNLVNRPTNGATLGRAGWIGSIIGALLVMFVARRMGYM